MINFLRKYFRIYFVLFDLKLQIQLYQLNLKLFTFLNIYI